MTIIGIIFYSIVFIFLLYRLTRKKVPLTVVELSLAFLFKVALGCLYGYIYLHVYNGDDTWKLHNYSLIDLQKLLHNPVYYFTELGPAESFAWAGGGFWDGLSAYIHTLENDSTIKILSIANLFTRSNYYINVVFFNFILFWGPYWLFGLLVKEFPEKRKPLLLLIFFFPPLVFWLSGIRGDGLVLFFMALTLVHFRRWVYENKKWSILYCILALIGVVIYRTQFVLLLIPALLAWYISVKFNRNAVATFLWVFGISGVLFFASAWVSPQKNGPLIVTERQQSFMQLEGTRFHLDTLQPTVTSFIKVLPQAVSHTFLRPYIWEAKGALQLMTAAEIIVCWLLVLTAIIKKEMHWRQPLQKPVLVFCLGLGITLYIFIGYTVPFPGAIVRYKAIPELLLLTIPVICTNWAFLQKINKKLYI
ncbi:hypothetical protein A3860_16830 [Niastella vici]|uniref:Glycosyltransferase RgtA/B/C/D-like domain-containing protein n=1 Tax=Niastella vici TaxID=1703345 RepID=A0A1V9G432_9BACT|nr:hypothetical protein [Niastella vici]OQP65332.1 hypothetical protein A3860_16830 [Niastella vici]